MNSDQLVNDIEKLKQHNILIENELQELRIFYITNKEKYDYDYKLAKIFFDNLKNFIEKEIISDNSSYLKNKLESNDYNNYIIINYNPSYKSIIDNCLIISEHFNNGGSGATSDQLKQYKQDVDDSFNFICNYVEERLILRMLINEKKLKCYENLLKLYHVPNSENLEIDNINPNKAEIEKNSIISIDLDNAYYKIEEYCSALDEAYSKINKYEKKLTELYSMCEKPESVTTSVIFLIMIVFYVITVTTVVLLVNYNYNYNIDIMHHSMQCSQSTRIIDKHNKLKDIMITKL